MRAHGATRLSPPFARAETRGRVRLGQATARGFAEKRAKGRCTIKSYDIQGNTVKYALICGDRTIESATTFTGDTSEGTQTTTTADGKVDTRTIKARRLGACP